MSRTVIYALVNLLVALLAASGIEIPEAMQQALRENLEAVVVAGLAINGVIVWVLRAATRTPLASCIHKEPS